MIINNKFRYVLPIVWLLFWEYLIWGPLEIYSANQQELNFSYLSFLEPLIVVFLLMTGCSIFILYRLNDKVSYIICNILLCFSIMSYIQAMFLNLKLVEDNGGTFHWEEYELYSYSNMVIWVIGIILLFAIFRMLETKIMKGITSFIALFCLLVQIVTVVFILFSTDVHPNNIYQYNGTLQYKVGSERNIFILIIDSFGNNQFDRLVNQENELFCSLKDFTRYENTNSVYPNTFPSLDCMLSGFPVDSEMIISDWEERAWTSKENVSFFDEIHECGFKFNIFTSANFGKGKNLVDKFDNIVIEASNINKKLLLSKMVKLSMFRYVPYILKPYFEVDATEFLYMGDRFSDNWIYPETTNEGFYFGLKNQGFSVDENVHSVINLSHIWGMHVPYSTNEECEKEEKVSELQTAKGINIIVDEYLRQIKSCGKYDCSTIIIMADHGGEIIEDVTPIMFVKRPNEEHEKFISNMSPVSHTDFRATILQLCGSRRYKDFGTSIFDLESNIDRTRFFYIKREGDITPLGERIYNFDEIKYNGDRNTLSDEIKKNYYKE